MLCLVLTSTKLKSRVPCIRRPHPRTHPHNDYYCNNSNGRYIESIRTVAEVQGIAKIVPPEGWVLPPTPMEGHKQKLLRTKKQSIHTLMNVRKIKLALRVVG